MSELAKGLTRKQYHDAGWSDDMLINAKMMNAPTNPDILNPNLHGGW